MDTKERVLRGLVKPPIWDKGNDYGGASAWLSFNEKGRFCYGVDLGGLFYIQTPDGEQDGFPTLAAAQAAAEADYRARIAAALALNKLIALVEAADAYKDVRMKVDDTDEFCALVAALSALMGDATGTGG